MLKATALSPDPIDNLQLALGIELAVMPPYLYALWSIRDGDEGSSVAARESANILRSVLYEEMLHAALGANILHALGATPRLDLHPMTYPGPLPGHVETGPYAYNVGLGPLSPTSITTFLNIERPDWPTARTAASVTPGASDDWITLGAFYEALKAQLRALPPDRFRGVQQLPARENPAPGRLTQVVDLHSSLQAIDTIVLQGEGHKPPPPDPDNPDDTYKLDGDREVAHYYQFTTICDYFTQGHIKPADVSPVIENPDAARYTAEQRAANDAFNAVYSRLIDGLQAALMAPSPSVFGGPTRSMRALSHAAAVLRNAGVVPGTSAVAGPTFQIVRGQGEH